MRPSHIREFTLDNGLKVLCSPGKDRTVSGKLLVRHASMHERKGESGIAHFLEHVLVTGGTKRFTPEQVEDIIEELGVHNATTGIEQTSFPAEMLPSELSTYLDLISDRVFSPMYDSTAIDQERGRVIQEMGDRYGNFAHPAVVRYTELTFGSDHPRARQVLGSPDVVRAATKDDLEQFRKRGYHPNNMTLILAGCLPRNVDKLIDGYFGHGPPGASNSEGVPVARPIRGINDIRYPLPVNGSGELTSASVSLTFSGPRDGEDGYYEAKMLGHLLGGGISSQLHKYVGRELGIYGIAGGYQDSKDYGLMQVSASVNPGAVDEILDAVFRQFQDLRTVPVESERLRRAAKKLTFSTFKMLDSIDGRFGETELFAEYGHGFDYFVNRMANVTPEGVREAARRIFPKERDSGDYILSLWSPNIATPNF